MKVVTSEIMRKIDSYCIEELKIPGIVLMENAALKVIKNIDLAKNNSFTVICGKGNNGGDGLAVSRHLITLGKKAEVFLMGSDENISEDAKINAYILKNMGVKINRVSNVEDINDLRDSIVRNDITIDAIFGTGLCREVEGIYYQVISIINENSSYTLSIDVPSGFNSDTGKIMGNCVTAHKTVSFQMFKRGFLSYNTDKLTGEVVVENIGIPEAVVDKFHNNEFIMDENMIKDKFIARDKYCYKGDYGRVLIFAGSMGFSGAAYISSQSAVRTGAGLVTLCCDNSIRGILSEKLSEAMTISYDDRERLAELVEKSNAIAVGPGMGMSSQTLETLSYIIKNAECPVVIDADGINVLKDNLDILKERKKEIVITPHFGEMSRITGCSIDEIRDNRIEIAKNFAEKYGVIVLLKGYNTIISDGTTTIINPTGNSSMASGGMGDCLTGMVASLIGQGYSAFESACMAAYIHGFTGERLSKKMFCVNATHLLEELPYTMKEFQI